MLLQLNSLPIITSDIRTLRHIETAVNEHASCAGDHCPAPITECLITRGAELLEILSVCDVCSFQTTTTTVSNLPQGELEQSGVLEVNGMRQRVHGFVNVEAPAPTPVVCYCFVIPPSDSLLTICSIQTVSESYKCDRQSDESCLPEPSSSSLLDRNLGIVEDTTLPKDSVDESGAHIPDSDNRALRRLVRCEVSQNELPSLIETIVSNTKAADIVKCLKETDAQTFIDVIDKACHHAAQSLKNCFIDLFSPSNPVGQALDDLNFTSRIRKKCVKSLYMMCAGHALLPSSLRFELPENPTGVIVYRSRHADVLKREYRGREVAVKALLVYDNSCLRDVTKVSYSLASYLFHISGIEYNPCRGSVRKSSLGNLFGIRMCCRCWG